MLAQAEMPVVFVPGQDISQGREAFSFLDGRENT